jgi:hypothetical protein
MVTRHAVNSGKSASPVRHHEIANPLETEIEPDDLAWATRSGMWRARAEKASARRAKRAKPAPALVLAGHGVSLRVEGSALRPAS